MATAVFTVRVGEVQRSIGLDLMLVTSSVCGRKISAQSPLLNYANATNDESVRELNSSTYRHRLASERELIHRNQLTYKQFLDRVVATRNTTRNLVDYLQSDALDKVLQLADANSELLGVAVMQLVTAEDIPDMGVAGEVVMLGSNANSHPRIPQ